MLILGELITISNWVTPTQTKPSEVGLLPRMMDRSDFQSLTHIGCSNTDDQISDRKRQFQVSKKEYYIGSTNNVIFLSRPCTMCTLIISITTTAKKKLIYHIYF